MADQQININDIMSSFASSSSGGDEEILKIASNYALQISPAQISTLLKLEMFALDRGTKQNKLKEKIDAFISSYLEIKKYHESGQFIRAIIADLALKKIVPDDAVKVNVMKQ